MDRKGVGENAVRSLTECSSAEEFRLKLSVMGATAEFSFDDLSDMLYELSERPYFMRPLVDLVSDSHIFDAAVAEEELGLDYSFAKAFSKGVRKAPYRRFKALVHFANDTPEWGWRNSNRYSDAEKKALDADFADLLRAIVGKIEEKAGTGVPSVRNFKRLMKL